MYEKLARIERQLSSIENDLLRRSYLATRAKFAERAHVIAAEIPSFWPAVIDEAPEEIDRRIQPRDVPVFNSLEAIDVERFEVTDEECGEPRSVKLTFNFKPNEWFEDKVLEKRFWWRASEDGWSGLVSEPVNIKWKEKDLTEGLLGMAVSLWNLENEMKGKGLAFEDIKTTHEYSDLVGRIEQTPQDAVSVFAFFGFRGHDVTAEESSVAVQKETERLNDLEPWKEIDSGEKQLPETEIYPYGEELAVAFAEDLFPEAIQYFTKAQERDATGSDEDSVSDSDNSIPGDDEDEPLSERKRL